jgi:glycosyltransferase involved in cell wall biosynthesis
MGLRSHMNSTASATLSGDRQSSRATTDEPLVTIAVPTLNRAAWLGRCIGSALSQSYGNFEVVVSDNASTDDTPKVLGQFSDARLRVVRQQTTVSLLENWNSSLAYAKGKYIVFVSDDDIIAPHMLERCIAVANRDPQVTAILSLCDVYYPADEKVVRAVPAERYHTGIWNGVDLLLGCLRGNIPTVMCSIMMRTDALRVRGGFPVELPNFGADMAAWARLLLKGRAGFVNESCSTYCIHNASETSTLTSERRLKDEQEFMNFIVRLADSTIEDPEDRRQIRFEAERWLARRLVFGLAQRHGAGGTEVMARIWGRRHDLMRVVIKHRAYALWLLAIATFPESITKRIRVLKQSIRS